jgi:aminocarboxymuconate-semialdehyde decarboxylase
VRVVDAHFHWFPRSHFEHMVRRSEEPRAQRDGDGYVYRFNGGRNFMTLDGSWFDLEAGLEISSAATGPDTLVVATAGVLSGMLDQLPATVAADLAHEYNDELAAAQRKYAGRVVGTALIPLHDTAEALRLLDHAVGDLDLRAVNLGPMADDGPIDALRLEPFYARVAELGVPLVVHPTDISFGPVLTGYDRAMQLTIGRLLDSSVTTLRLIFSGIMERYPELKIIHTHAGGLLPYQAGRIDKNNPVRLPHPPSHYLKRIFVDTVAPQDLTIRTAVEFYGVHQVMYGTDHPCWSPAAARQVIDDARLRPEEVELVMSRNAGTILNLD